MHRHGYVEYGDRDACVHWTERRMTKRGLRRFLKHVASAKWPEQMVGERFVVLYHQNIQADGLARLLGIRIPRSLADQDRAMVRFYLQKFRNDPLDREFPEQRQLMRRIQRWARP